MKSQFGGLLSAFLMLTPLLAVPAIAVIGIPDQRRSDAFTDDGFLDMTDLESTDPLDDSTHGLSSEFQPADSQREPAASANASAMNSPARQEFANPLEQQTEAEPLFSPFVTVEDADEVARIFASAAEDSDAAAVSPFETPAEPAPAFAAEHTGNHSTINESSSDNQTNGKTQAETEAVSWPTVVQRLNDLGITKYRLQESRTGNGFSFVCLYAHPSQPEIQHRFEADGDEPIQAVVDVLSQIHRWQDSTPVAMSSTGR